MSYSEKNSKSQTMENASVTLQIPESLYHRLRSTASALGRSVEEVMIHALTIGVPPQWSDVPEEFQAELACLDRFDNNSLWQIALSSQSSTDMERYNQLLQKNQESELTSTEQLELEQLRYAADLFMLKKAQAIVLLRWRGEQVPLSGI